MEVLQAPSCLPTMQQFVLSLSLHMSLTGLLLRHVDQAGDHD